VDDFKKALNGGGSVAETTQTKNVAAVDELMKNAMAKTEKNERLKALRKVF